MSHFLDRLMFLTQHREPFAGGHGETRMEDRKWEEGYRLPLAARQDRALDAPA
jgi:nitrate reductase alpha subunit